MSKPANKTLIGAFVVGAIALIASAIVLFGSGRFFRDISINVAFFEGSVKGLNVGSPVTFRGVQVGQVTEIIAGFDPIGLEVYIPVIFEIDDRKFLYLGESEAGFESYDEEAFAKALIERGFRAQLQLQSLVTGRLSINLDFLPNTPVRLVGIHAFKDELDIEPWWEIPTIPSPLQRLEASLEKISFEDLVDDIRKAMDGIATLATSPDLHASIGELKQTLVAVKELARHVDAKVDPLTTSLDQTLVDVRAGIGDARVLMNNDIRAALKSARTALDNANRTLASIENLADEGTQLRHEISATLIEVSAAARSVRVLADFIEQHPDAVLRGRVTRTGGN